MKGSPSHRKTVKHQFDSLCRKVLRDESCDIKKQRIKRAEREICFSDLSAAEWSQLYAMDCYPSDSTQFTVLDYCVSVADDRLAEALQFLSDEKRDIILLSFFLDMNDREIGDALNIVRYTVQRRRSSSLQELRLRMEGEENGEKTEWKK